MPVDKLCVGAASRIVVEEAAKLHVPQIVASRSQVNTAGGYIGMDQHELVEVVRDLSDGETAVIRDHGGPLQGGFEDDGTEDFDRCVEAGFDGLHIDVCMLPRREQLSTLEELLARYSGADVELEIGGEHDDQQWLDVLVEVALDSGFHPSVAVADVGGYCWADRQTGNFRAPGDVKQIVERYHGLGLLVKAHNTDDYGRRKRYVDLLDYWNVAPEYGKLETEAVLALLPFKIEQRVLALAYGTQKWKRWFNDDEGTHRERAKCALRYVRSLPRINNLITPYWSSDAEEFVRQTVRNGMVI